MMSFYPQSFCAPAEASFNPLFRLLEDFDKLAREAQKPQARCQQRPTQQQRRSPLATFTPKFDIRETENTYELHGELPGLERENVNIEFTEPQTLVIRGRVERSYASEPITTTTESATAESTTAENTTPEVNEKETSRRSSFQATVEDDPEDENTPASTPATSPKTEVAKPVAETQDVTKPAAPQQEQPKYWRRERSVGEFSRAFTFPARVEYEDVTASLNNGILSVTIPKAKKPVARRIVIGY